MPRLLMQPFLARSESKFHSKMIKLKIDENLPKEVAQLFNQRGRNAQTVLDQNLKGCTDEILLSICQEEKRILVTLDLDFSNITLYPPGTYEGIIVFRVKNQSKNTILSLIPMIDKMLDKEKLRGKLWIVEKERIRIHEPFNS